MIIIFTFLTAFIIVFLLFCLLLQIFYWYETINSPCTELNTPSFSVPDALGQFFSSLTIYSLRPIIFFLWFLKQRKKKGICITTDQTPIVLIHGLYDTSASWLYIASRLEKDNFYPVTFSYHSFADPNAITAALDDFILLLTSSTEKKPIIVGHSNGGIVIQKWLYEKSASDRIKGVITIATPFHGSKLAIFAPGRLGKTLRPNSSLIQSLQTAPHPTVPCFALASCADQIVLPESSLLPPLGWTLQNTGWQNHLGMLFSPNVYQQIQKDIQAIINK